MSRANSGSRATKLLHVSGLAVLVAGLAAGVPASAAAGFPARVAGQWTTAGQNLGDTHFQAAEHVISPANVSRLAPRWTLTTSGNVSATPTVYAGTVYVPDSGGTLWAVDAASGRAVWSHSIAGYTGVAGDVSRTSPAVHGDELITGDGWNVGVDTGGAHVFAVSRLTGNLLWSTKVDSFAGSIITGSPAVYRGVAYVGISSNEEAKATQPGYQCCTFRGAVVALDARTGHILWKMYTVPSNNGGGDVNLPGYYSGNAVWGSSPAIDPARGLLYVSTGNNYTVPPAVCATPGQAGCTQPSATDYVDSILALRLGDGTVAWAFHTLTSDVSSSFGSGLDFDFGASPNLFTFRGAGGRPEQLLGTGQKSGVYWALNPGTGKLVWSTQAAPGGGVGGIEWGTATDGRRVYVAEADSDGLSYTLGGSGPYAGRTITGGSWAALDGRTGKILWQTPDPQSALDVGFVSAANSVVYAGSGAGTGANMYALDAATGQILFSFASGGAVVSGAAIVNGSVYWGSGYNFASGCPPTEPSCGSNDKLYAFGL
jgi:polyvinyl alcohol dehydrogenase (cytochrome)